MVLCFIHNLRCEVHENSDGIEIGSRGATKKTTRFAAWNATELIVAIPVAILAAKNEILV